MASGTPLGRASGGGRMHKSSVYLPEALKARLAALARRSARSEAQLLRLGPVSYTHLTLPTTERV